MIRSDVVGDLGRAVGVLSVAVPVDRPDRTGERAAGRRAAAGALEAAGCPDLLVGADPDGRPRWPGDYVGSIAHTDRWAVAAVVRVEDFGAVGIDIERRDALPVDDAEVVLSSSEREQVRAARSPARAATLLWSAKEAAFKAWSSAHGRAIDPVDPVDIAITVVDDRIMVRPCGALAAVVGTAGLTGRWAELDDHVVTVVVAPARLG